MDTLFSTLSVLPQKNGVFLHRQKAGETSSWKTFQEREKAFWRHKILHTDYQPDPKKNFAPFLGHWGIDSSFFQGKNAIETGSGPFGFFAGLQRICADHLPTPLIIADPLLEFYQQFTLMRMMPRDAILLQARGEDIPLPDHCMDIIVSTNTIDHVEDSFAFLKEARRILKDNGTLLFSVHVLPSFLASGKSLIKHLDRNHPHHFTARGIHDLFSNTGFSITRARQVPMYLEDDIPTEIQGWKRVMYFLAFRCLRTFYGMARLQKNT